MQSTVPFAGRDFSLSVLEAVKPTTLNNGKCPSYETANRGQRLQCHILENDVVWNQNVFPRLAIVCLGMSACLAAPFNCGIALSDDFGIVHLAVRLRLQ